MAKYNSLMKRIRKHRESMLDDLKEFSTTWRSAFWISETLEKVKNDIQYAYYDDDIITPYQFSLLENWYLQFKSYIMEELSNKYDKERRCI